MAFGEDMVWQWLNWQHGCAVCCMIYIKLCSLRIGSLEGYVVVYFVRVRSTVSALYSIGRVHSYEWWK